MSTAAEKRHMSAVASLGCIVCRRLGYSDTPACVHHIRTGVGMGKRASNLDTLPLCHHHHQGAEGIHGMGRKAWERHFGFTEVELLEQTKAEVGAVMVRLYG